MNRLNNTAKTLRKRSTEAEKLLWSHLRLKQIEGIKFRRQQPIDNYVVDFASFKYRLLVEVDGGQHSTDKERDNERDQYLRMQGFEVLRFWNNDILHNVKGVLEIIREYCLKHPPPPLPSREGCIVGTSPLETSKETYLSHFAKEKDRIPCTSFLNGNNKLESDKKALRKG